MMLIEIYSALRKFATDRDWQDVHTPSNLAAALSVEAAELLELHLWGAEPDIDFIRGEVADIAIYLIRYCDVLELDLEQAIIDKVEINRKRFPPKVRS